MDVPMWFLHEVSAFWRKKYTFFSLNACPLEEKSSFLSFLGATKTKPYSLVCFTLFCLVKRIVEYFAKE